MASLSAVPAVFAGRGAVSIEASIGIALFSMFALGVGGWLWWLTSGLGVLVPSQSVFLRSALFGTAASFALWLGWLVVAFAVLQRATGSAVPMERLVREAGVATAPLALGVLMVVPFLSFGIGVAAVGIWVVSMQNALERATGVRGGPVTVANALGFTVWASVLSLLGAGGQTFAPGPFLAHAVWESVARNLAHTLR
jgi:hypothetical protein